MAAKKFLSGIDLGNQRINNVADGSAATDAVNLQQLQAYVKGLQWKQAVRVASTANLAVATAVINGATVDGVTLATGDRILLKNQTTTTENGVYVVVASGAASRALDMTDSAHGPDGVQTLVGGSTVFVENGTLGADTAWTLNTPDPIVVGTTPLTFAQLGGGTTYTAASTGGLSLSSGAFSVKLPASSGLITDATGLYLDGSIAVKKYAAALGDGSTTAITITHSLGTRDIICSLYDATAYNEVETDVVHTSTTTVTLNFAVAPTASQYRVVVHA